jgi:hypothetical protein
VGIEALGIRHVDDQRAMRVAHVSDVRDSFFDDDLPAARAVMPAEALKTAPHRRSVPRAATLSGIHVRHFAYPFCTAHSLRSVLYSADLVVLA